MTRKAPYSGEPTPIGEFAEPSFVRLPDPAVLFRARAARFDALAQAHTLAPYLTFLGTLSAIQARLAESLPVPAIPPLEDVEGAYGPAQAPVERTRYAPDEVALASVEALLAALADVAMPEAARQALSRLAAMGAAERAAALVRVLEEPAPSEALAEHSLLSGALQIVFAKMAAGMDADRLQPVAEGTACPVCSSPPLASLIVGWPGARNTRYCACGLCGTAWNYVRIKCTLCGSTKGIAYHGIDGDAGTIKAESCESCRRYIKILYQQKDPALEPLADDVASLGLDLLMREIGFARGAVNPFLLGY
ncbi:MAG: formate dehydrogenase accessory protein FdhE [Rhodospirillales bacterium]|nr:formate dehydrogenase accessory protein FdhE [Rhodospirillales bacterium]